MDLEEDNSKDIRVKDLDNLDLIQIRQDDNLLYDSDARGSESARNDEAWADGDNNINIGEQLTDKGDDTSEQLSEDGDDNMDTSDQIPEDDDLEAGKSHTILGDNELTCKTGDSTTRGSGKGLTMSGESVCWFPCFLSIYIHDIYPFLGCRNRVFGSSGHRRSIVHLRSCTCKTGHFLLIIYSATMPSSTGMHGKPILHVTEWSLDSYYTGMTHVSK